jgi:hypothetical protein
MLGFNVPKNRIILIPEELLPARKGAEELSRYIDLLRKQRACPPDFPAPFYAQPFKPVI